MSCVVPTGALNAVHEATNDSNRHKKTLSRSHHFDLLKNVGDRVTILTTPAYPEGDGI